MNTRILITVVLLLIVTGTMARQCYQCFACPKPFRGNEAGVAVITVGDNNYCQKTVALGIESRDDGGPNCTPVGSVQYCCQGDLCNGATTTTSSVKLLAAVASVFLAVRCSY